MENGYYLPIIRSLYPLSVNNAKKYLKMSEARIPSLSDQIINCIEQRPSCETNSHSASQEIPRLLWNSKVHYLVSISPPQVHALIQMHPVSLRSIIILSSRLCLRLPSGLFASGFLTKMVYASFNERLSYKQ